MTIIKRMLRISRRMRSKRMSLKDILRSSPDDVRALSEKLDMPPEEAVLLTVIFRNSSHYVNEDLLAEELGMDYLELQDSYGMIRDLRTRGYIRINKGSGTIAMPENAKDCLRDNKTMKPPKTTNLDAGGLLSGIKRVLSTLSDDQCSTEEAAEELEELMNKNKENSVSRGIRKYLKVIGRDEKIILYCLVFLYYFEELDMVSWDALMNFVSEEHLDWLKGKYRREKMDLQSNRIIEYTGQAGDGVLDKSCFHLTLEAKESIFADMGVVLKNAPVVSSSLKIEAGKIVPKEMFYNPDETNEVARLKEILSEDRFQDIRRKLKERGLRRGFTCLFHGVPGTGKTETVYQIARESGRDLFRVDVSQIKSCWAGESEQNLKEVFNKYRTCVSAGGKVPILLFNEADAIFGIRQQGAERAIDKMENSLQNIILQETEDLDGILIATTNLTQNLDQAFDRRFLYKIRFKKPSPEVRSRIWRTMLPELTEDQSVRLASDYDFSGGQIENIARKRIIQALLDLKEPSFDDILGFCREETLKPGGSGRIGF